jgi:uncharacterized membrane protein
MASTLTVMTTPTESGAEDILGVLANLQKQELIKIDDAAWVRRGLDGKAKVKQAVNLVGQGALGGAFWGMLIGLLFLAPWLGAAIGAASGALSGRAADFGIDDEFIKTVGGRIVPGSSALFLLTHDAVADKVAGALKGHNFEIIHTNLPSEQEAEMRALFAD